MARSPSIPAKRLPVEGMTFSEAPGGAPFSARSAT